MFASTFSTAFLLVSALVSSSLASPFPQETGAPTTTNIENPSITPSPTTTSLVTTAPGLTCTNGSTVLFTTACTIGTPISYCHKDPPPITCSASSWPGWWSPVRCFREQTCYPVTADWITTECSNGQFPYSTSTLYSGTLSGETTATIISSVACHCSTQDYYSYYWDGAKGHWYCLPHTNCPTPMTTSLSTNEFCATADTSTYTYCSTLKDPSPFCQCPPSSTAIYPTGTAASPTGCAAATTTTPA